MTKTKTIYKIKWKNVIKLGILITILTVIITLGNLIFTTYGDYRDTKTMIEIIEEKSKKTNVVDNENTTIIEPTENLSKFDSYWNYIKMSFIKVDMASLKKINSNAVGWIQLKGTNLDYPIVQHNDNTFYKNHSFNREKNKYGWLYLDYKNNSQELDSNNVIYGNSTVFDILYGNLKDVFKKSWQNDDDNFIIKYSTSNYTTLWQIVSIYKTDSKEHEKNIFGEGEFDSFIKNITDKSEYDFNTDVNEQDKILTLTTNSEKENIVVQAKLIKIRKEL